MSCKTNYKKFTSREKLRSLLIDIIDAGCLNDFESHFSEYESFFMQYNNVDTFIDKLLVPVNEIREFEYIDKKSLINKQLSLKDNAINTTEGRNQTGMDYSSVSYGMVQDEGNFGQKNEEIKINEIEENTNLNVKF